MLLLYLKPLVLVGSVRVIVDAVGSAIGSIYACDL